MDNLIEVMDSIKGGATIWGRKEAGEIRELEKEHKDWVTLVFGKELEHILGYTIPGESQQPYFGAILTDEGKKQLRKLRKQAKNTQLKGK